jgi:phosphoribosylanthranilate isomerase
MKRAMVRVKICGITNEDDARTACDAGADTLGFNFYKESPRHVSAGEIAKFRAHLPEHVEVVGVFVNAGQSDIVKICDLLKLDAVQLHGDETPQRIAELAATIQVIKAFRVGPDFLVETLDEYAKASAYLLDAAETGQYGGTGRTNDWTLARSAARTRRIILAGGLKAENVAAAIHFVRPYGVDVASGVESKAGKKDQTRLCRFIEEVRRAERHPEMMKVNSTNP